MICLVVRDYKDKEAGATLREAGQVLDIVDEDRALALTSKGFVVPKEIIKVEKEKALEAMTLQELKEEARKKGLKYGPKATKKDLLSLLQE